MTDKEQRAHDLTLLALLIESLKEDKHDLFSDAFVHRYEGNYKKFFYALDDKFIKD